MTASIHRATGLILIGVCGGWDTRTASQVILQATQDCSDAEWQRRYEAIVACVNVMK
ncbi:MAG: hypothetical protein WA715_21245 [Candidatus Acidiferrum sp.]|jgi:hypothetical protein